MTRPCRAAAALVAVMLIAASVGTEAFQADDPVTEPSPPPVRGCVIDATGPVAGARVGFQGKTARTLTRTDGTFTLPASTDTGSRVVAAKPGYFIAGVDRADHRPITIRLCRHPQGDCPDYRWTDPRPNAERPDQCGNCHLEIYREWAASPHGRSAVNRRFMNLYEGTDWQGNEDIGWSLLAEYPEGSGVCGPCHVPSVEPSPKHDDLRLITGVDRQGIHCDFCHKVADVSIEKVGLDHGRFAMRLVRPRPGEKIFFGSMDDEDRGNAVYEPLYAKSRYCASCHEGVVFGTHAYSEYSEWLASDYAARGVQCQDCHMAPTGRMTNIAPGHGGIERDPATLPSHAAARYDPRVLRRHLSLRLTGRPLGDAVEITAEVTVDGIGHRTPTGYPSRQLILSVEATDAEGKSVPLRSGPVLPPAAGEGAASQGNLAGRPGWLYAKLLEGLDGRQPVPYWQPNRLKSDTRLMPDETDRRRFRFVRPSGRLTVVARLIYRRFSKYQADEKGWPDNEFVVCQQRWTTGQPPDTEGR